MTTSTPRQRSLLLIALGVGVLCFAAGVAGREPAPLSETPPFVCERPVEVGGLVGRAGLVCPSEPSVSSAVAAAGGVVGCSLTDDTARHGLLAGQRVLVGEGERGACAVRVVAMEGERLLALGLRIDVNHADPSSLDALPGIGPGLAKRIASERARRVFTRIEDLRRVRGIGPKTFARLLPYVTTGDVSASP